MQSIRLADKEYTAISGWSEVTAADLLYLGMVSSLRHADDRSLYFLIVKLFKLPRMQFFKLLKSQKVQLKRTLSWLFKRNEIENWLLKTVKYKQIDLAGPKNRLDDLTAEEFMYCEAYYERWLETEDPALLDGLFGTLYRKKSVFTNKRLPFNRNRRDIYEARAKHIKPYIKRAVAINYAGCRNLIISRHPDVWKEREATSDIGLPKYTSWAGFILDLAGDKFGTYEQTLKTEIWLVLADLNKKAKTAAELEALSKR